MKPRYLIPVAAVAVCTLVAFSQEIIESLTGPSPAEIAALPDARIVGGISDGTRAPAAPKPDPIDFLVIDSHNRSEHVKLAPEMPGLPAPEGTRNVTVQYVAAPDLPEEEGPMPIVQVEGSEQEGFTEELLAQYRETHMVMISASVHENGVTRFEIQEVGNDSKPVSGWSNVDFHHFSGFAYFELKQRDGSYKRYGIMMGVGDATHPDPDLQIPNLPSLEAEGPKFIVHKGDKGNPKGLELVEGIHTLYAIEGDRLAAAQASRKRAYEARKAELLANPPKPKDVTISFWDKPTVPAQ